MRIEEAIRISRRRDTEGDEGNDEDNYEATQLGVEALKYRKLAKEAGYLDEDDLLPGETK